MIVNFNSLINLKTNLVKGIAVITFKVFIAFMVLCLTVTLLNSCGQPDNETTESTNPNIELLSSYEEGDNFDLECADFEKLLCSKEILDKDGILQTSFYFSDIPSQGRFVNFAISFIIEDSIIVKKNN